MLHVYFFRVYMCGWTLAAFCFSCFLALLFSSSRFTCIQQIIMITCDCSHIHTHVSSHHNIYCMWSEVSLATHLPLRQIVAASCEHCLYEPCSTGKLQYLYLCIRFMFSHRIRIHCGRCCYSNTSSIASASRKICNSLFKKYCQSFRFESDLDRLIIESQYTHIHIFWLSLRFIAYTLIRVQSEMNIFNANCTKKKNHKTHKTEIA